MNPNKLSANEYQYRARRTANLTTALDMRMSNWALGLIGEAGEIARINFDQSDWKDNLILEVGDLFWYGANIAQDLSRPLNEVLGSNNLDYFQYGAGGVDPIQRVRGGFYNLLVNATMVGELVKKKYHHHKAIPSEEILTYTKRTLNSGSLMLVEVNVRLSDALMKNIEKLEARHGDKWSGV